MEITTESSVPHSIVKGGSEALTAAEYPLINEDRLGAPPTVKAPLIGIS